MEMLPGIMVKPLKRLADERGYFTEIMRCDWKDLLGDCDIQQSNMSTTYPGIVRAWHMHERGQVDHFLVIGGGAKICAYDERTRELDEIVSTGKDLQVIRMPGQYWHGFRSIGQEPATLIYFTNRLYDPADPDEVRRPWNDEKIVPKVINGKRDDPRCGKRWSWFRPPHR